MEERGLYVLLAEADSIDPTRALADAEPVVRRNLLEHPQAYRGHLVKLAMQVQEIQGVEPENRAAWPRPVWAVNGLDDHDGEAVTIILTDDTGLQVRGSRVWAVGRFLKLRTDHRRRPDPKTGETMVTLPVLVGKSLASLPGPSSSGDSSTMIVGLAVALAAGYLLLRRNLRPRPAPSGEFQRAGRARRPSQLRTEQQDMIADRDPAEALDRLARGSRPTDPDSEPQDKPDA